MQEKIAAWQQKLNQMTQKDQLPQLYLLTKSVLAYVGMLLFAIFVFNLLEINMSQVAQISWSVMLIVGAITAHFVPEDQEKTIKDAKWMSFGYLLLLFVWQFVLNNPDMVAALGGSDTNGGTLAGSLGTFNFIVLVMYPLGYLIMMVQKFRIHSTRMKTQDKLQQMKNRK